MFLNIVSTLFIEVLFLRKKKVAPERSRKEPADDEKRDARDADEPEDDYEKMMAEALGVLADEAPAEGLVEEIRSKQTHVAPTVSLRRQSSDDDSHIRIFSDFCGFPRLFTLGGLKKWAPA